MKKVIKKIFLGSLSILGISFLFWTVLLLNPSISYANSTTIGNITIYHNSQLEIRTEKVLTDAYTIIKKADIFDESLKIELCFNDDKIYPKLHPLAGATAYAFLNKTVFYRSKPVFNTNIAEFKWQENDYELRKYNLTRLLSHEFTHNLQYHIDSWAPLKFDAWKLEGHAEFCAREFNGDNTLKEKITQLLDEEIKPHIGIPVIFLEDSTIQNLAYFKFALMWQYCKEQENLKYSQIMADKRSFEEIYNKMLNWHTTSK